MPESSSLIGQFTGSRHYFYVTDDSRLSNLHNYFSNKKRKLLDIVKLMTNHDHFFSHYFLSALFGQVSQNLEVGMTVFFLSGVGILTLPSLKELNHRDSP